MSGRSGLDEFMVAQLCQQTADISGYRVRAYVRKLSVDPCYDLIHVTAHRRQQTPNLESDLIEAEVDLRLGGKEDRAFLHFFENDG
jgi:hypothetical protein